MKNYFYPLIVIGLLFFLFSCNQKTSVIDSLDLKSVSKLIEKDTLYEVVIPEVEEIKSIIDSNLVLLSKFQYLTYEEYYEFKKTTLDTSFINDLLKKAEELLANKNLNLINKYKGRIDSIMSKYQSLNNLYNPAKYFKIEFSGIDKEYYSSMNEVKAVNVAFKIIPLKGTIQGGSFQYGVIPKVTGKSIGHDDCRFVSLTTKPSIYRWEAPYDIEDEFEDENSNSIKNKYDFEYSVVTARKGGKTYSIKRKYDFKHTFLTARKGGNTYYLSDIDIPHSYERRIEKDSLSYSDYLLLIWFEYEIEPELFSEVFEKLLAKEKQKINKIASEFEKIADL